MADMPESVTRTNVYNEVHHERERAHAKHGARGKSREDTAWDEHEWLAVVTEEVGEVAHELTYDAQDSQYPDARYDPLAARRQALRKELVQVAAMCCSWIDAIDRASP